MNIIAKDIWDRIIRKNGDRWGINPTWCLLGDEKKFGKLIVEFDDDNGVSFNIYIHNRQDLEIEIQKAIDNHEKFNEEEIMIICGEYPPRGLYR